MFFKIIQNKIISYKLIGLQFLVLLNFQMYKCLDLTISVLADLLVLKTSFKESNFFLVFTFSLGLQNFRSLTEIIKFFLTAKLLLNLRDEASKL